MRVSLSDSEPPRKRQRSMKKCEACRKLKVRCEPSERNFENGERCDQCKARGLTCGPHRRFQKQLDPTTHDVSTSATPPRSTTRRLEPSPFVSPNTSDRSFTEQDPGDDGFAGRHRAGAWNISAPSAVPPPFTASTCSPERPASTTVATSELRRVSERLHGKLDLIQHLRSRRRALARATPAISLAAFQAHEARLKIEKAYTHAVAQFASLLHIQLNTIEHTEDHKELFLRQLLENVRQFSQPPNLQVRLLPHSKTLAEEQSNIPELHGLILQRLITICDDQGQTGAADEFCVQLSALHLPTALDAQKRISVVSQNASARASTAARHLGLSLSAAHRLVPEISGETTSSRLYLAINSEVRTTPDPFDPCVVDIHRPHDCLGRGELHLAIEACNFGLVRRIIHHNASSLGDRDVFQISPLILAASLGHLGIFEFLLRKGARREELDVFCRDALVTACESGSDEIIEFLVPIHQNPNETHPLQICTALYAAAANGYVKAVRYLLAHGADVFAPVFGQTASEVAEAKGHFAVLTVLRAAVAKAATGSPIFGKHPDVTAHGSNGKSYTDHSNNNNLNHNPHTNSSGPNLYDPIASQASTQAEIPHSLLTTDSTQQHPSSRYPDFANVTSVKHTSLLLEDETGHFGTRPNDVSENMSQTIRWPPPTPANVAKSPSGSSPQETSLSSLFNPLSSPTLDSLLQANEDNGIDIRATSDMISTFDRPLDFDEVMGALRGHYT